MTRKKPILGLVEEVRIYLPNGKFIRRNAKIDTGARTTAIDLSIAKKIGKYEVYETFHKLLPKSLDFRSASVAAKWSCEHHRIVLIELATSFGIFGIKRLFPLHARALNRFE